MAHADRPPVAFYGTYVFDESRSIQLESTIPFYKVLDRLAGIYIVPRSTIDRFYGKPVAGAIIGNPLGKRVIYVADDLSHCDRLITIAHELIHLVLEMQGVSYRDHVDAEEWIDGLAIGFFEANPGFLDWLYKSEARIGN